MCRRQPGPAITQYLHDTALQQQHSWREVTKNIPLSALAYFSYFSPIYSLLLLIIFEAFRYPRRKKTTQNYSAQKYSWENYRFLFPDEKNSGILLWPTYICQKSLLAETSLTADGGHSRRLFNKYMSLSCCTIHVHAPAGRCRVPVFKTCCIQCSKFVFYSIFFYGQANILILCF